MSKKKTITPPKDLWLILVEPGGGNGSHPNWEKFWKLKKFDQKYSDQVQEVMYKTVASGLALTNWGLRRVIKKEIKRNLRGYTGVTLTLKELL